MKPSRISTKENEEIVLNSQKYETILEHDLLQWINGLLYNSLHLSETDESLGFSRVSVSVSIS